jgi:heme-degrading monooxygenase HmoA
MFSVLFEVNPHATQFDAYLDLAKTLRPELEAVDGFVDNVRYGSLNRDGWILSLSGWRDEKALVRWRTRAHHHDAQVSGRNEILADYHLRVGQITADTHIPDGQRLVEQRLDETQTGTAAAAVLLDTHIDPDAVSQHTAEHLAERLGLDRAADGLVDWDVYDAVLTPGDVMLMTTWRTAGDAGRFVADPGGSDGCRRRQVRIVRDYGMYDRQENPQYYPAVERTA